MNPIEGTILSEDLYVLYLILHGTACPGLLTINCLRSNDALGIACRALASRKQIIYSVSVEVHAPCQECKMQCMTAGLEGELRQEQKSLGHV